MSRLTDFVTSAATSAFGIIGTELVTIGGTSFACVLAEAEGSKDFEEGGNAYRKTLTATCKTSALPSGVLIKKQATARSVTYRVESVSEGRSFTTLTLTEATKA